LTARSKKKRIEKERNPDMGRTTLRLLAAGLVADAAFLLCSAGDRQWKVLGPGGGGAVLSFDQPSRHHARARGLRHDRHIRSSMGITSSEPIGKTPSSNSMKSFPGSCATNWFPTICAISD
jgi:hypothetical protein